MNVSKGEIQLNKNTKTTHSICVHCTVYRLRLVDKLSQVEEPEVSYYNITETDQLIRGNSSADKTFATLYISTAGSAH